MTIAADTTIGSSPYVGYTYGYPHKTAYRALEPPEPLEEAWREEDRSSLFAYLHIPFCEMRCGFCNLFTTALPPAELASAYLDALERHADAVLERVRGMQFARFALGGGTPTFFQPAELERLFRLLERLGIDPRHVPGSVETSPATATPERLALLRERGVQRVSMGVQSFVEAESKAMGRPQRPDVLERALENLAEAQFPCLNLDLIYGACGQTADSFLYSIERALDYGPTELYLYPLYIRPLTGLAKRGRAWDDQRLEAYRTGRDRLLDRGFEQVSMRMFRRPNGVGETGPAYCCQRDGMVGLGCGARSYTRSLHYSSDYAVGRANVREIIQDYLGLREEHGYARHGIWLNREEQVRRYLLMSLLQTEGLDTVTFAARFGVHPLTVLPEVQHLLGTGLALQEADRIVLTEAGLEQSDAIGPYLYSPAVRQRSEDYQWT